MVSRAGNYNSSFHNTRETAGVAAQPLVTIITTVHDLRPFVADCLNSVLRQSYTRWEQIVVDDGSTDGTEKVVASFTDPRIRYVRLPKRGISALARGYNEALTRSSGSLVAILEGDDFWPADKLARQVSGFADPEVQLSWGAAIAVDDFGSELWKWPSGFRRGRKLSLEELFRRLACANILTPTVTVMARRSAIDSAGGFHQPPGAPYVDLPTWLLIAAKVRGTALCQRDLLGYYRLHPAQMSVHHRFESLTSAEEVVDATIRQLDEVELARLGWSPRTARTARACADLRRGSALLHQGRMREARPHFRKAIRGAASPLKSLRALLGLVSASIGVDLLRVADGARRFAARR